MTSPDGTPSWTLAGLVDRARQATEGRDRVVIGIVGAPGAGKSTLAAALVDALDGDAALVPMDGYHLSNAVLAELGLADRKGAPETFDVHGYIALLRRLRARGPHTVYAPLFRREIEEPIAAGIGIDPTVPIVVTEGNYLLLDREPWGELADLLDDTWFVAPDEELRRERLVDRHVRHGRSRDEAVTWVLRSDETNARLVAETAHRADLRIDVLPDDLPLPEDRADEPSLGGTTTGPTPTPD